MITVLGKGTTLAALAKIEPVTPAAAGKRWKAIKHIDLINAVKAEAESRKWLLAEERYAVARDGADMAGALVFKKVAGVAALDGMAYSLGFVNSNARRKALKLTVGAHIFCCLNGLCTGEILLNTLHDHTVDIMAQVKDALTRYADAARTIPAMIKALRDRPLTRDEASQIIMEAGRKRLIGWAAVGRVDREYTHPTHLEHGRNTSWALLNAFTFAARPNIAPTNQMETYNDFRLLLPVAGGVS